MDYNEVIMNELIENITNNNFEKAKSIFFNNDLKRMHEAITEAAYTSGDEVFGKFYDYLLVNDSNNANLHYCIAELYTTVFNILPGGYEKAFKHAQKAIELAEDDLNYKEFILLFYELPTPLLSKDVAVKYATELLKADANNQAAKLVMKS